MNIYLTDEEKITWRGLARKTHGTRDPDWRWTVARKHAFDKGMVNQAYDPLTLQLMKYYRAWEAIRKKQVPNSQYQDFLDRYEDFGIAHQLAGNDDAFRWLLQALILSSVPMATLALRFNLSQYQVELFRDIFFDVENRLTAEDYIKYRVIDPFAGSDRHGPTCRVVWGLIGYCRGEETLRAFMDQAIAMTAERRALLDEQLGTILLQNAVAIGINPKAYGERGDMGLIAYNNYRQTGISERSMSKNPLGDGMRETAEQMVETISSVTSEPSLTSARSYAMLSGHEPRVRDMMEASLQERGLGVKTEPQETPAAAPAEGAKS